MDTKLASLIDRLESVVKRAESAQGQAPATTQQSAPTQSAAPGSDNALVKQWQSSVVAACKPLSEAANALNIAQVTTVTQQYISLVNLQPAIFLTMAKFKQPQDMAFVVAKNNEIVSAASLVKQKDFKSPPNHMQCVIDGMQMFAYPFFNDEELKESIKDFHDQISFYGNKVLKLDKDLDTKWYTAFKALTEAILSFVLMNLGKVSKWSGSEDASGAQAYLESITEQAMSGVVPSSGSSSAPVQANPAQATSAQAAPAQSGPASTADMYRKEVLSTLDALKSATTAIKISQVSKAVDQFVGLVEEQCLIYELQAKFAKPTNMLLLTKKKQEFFDALSLVKQKDFKAPVNHMGIILDSFSLFGAGLLPADDTGKEFLKEMHDSLPFLGNKIIKMDKANDTKWVESLLAVCKAHFQFVNKNYDAVHTWSGSSETGFEQAFQKGLQAAQPAPTQAAPVQAQAPVAAKPAPVVKKAPVKRPPVKNFRNKQWTFENYNGEDITLEGEEMVHKSFVHQFFACQNAVIKVVGKIKSISLEGCKKITLIVDDVVAEVNIMNCTGVKIFAQANLKSVTIESTSEVTLNLKHCNKTCKVATTCTRSIWVRWPKPDADEEDDDNVNWFRQPIMETYETEIADGKEIVTKPMESLE